MLSGNICRRLLCKRFCVPLHRQEARSVQTSSYEGDGKTTVSSLNKDEKSFLMVDTYSRSGFRLNNGLFVLGPIALFSRTVFQWNITEPEEITPESLSLFLLLEPKIDVLLIGTGYRRRDLDPSVLVKLRDSKINCEVLSTDRAIPVFNFLVSERRNVAAGLLPPLIMEKSQNFSDGAATKAIRGTFWRNESYTKKGIEYMKSEYEHLQEQYRKIEEMDKKDELKRLEKLKRLQEARNKPDDKKE